MVFASIMNVSASEGVVLSHKAIKDKALVGDEFVFSINVENPKNVTDRFRFYAPSSFWEWVFTVDPNPIVVGPESSEEVVLRLKPFSDRVDPGNYGVTLKLVSMNFSDIETEEVFDVEILTYDQVIERSLELPKKISSEEDNLFRVRLSNNYDFLVSNLSLELKSDYFDEKVDNIDLLDEEFVKEFIVNFGDKVKVGKNDIHLIIYHNGEKVIDDVNTINIEASGDISEVGTPEKGFLFYGETMEKTNNMNSISYERYTRRLSWFEKLFTEVSEEPSRIVKEGSYYDYIWEFSLEPGESKKIVIRTDYRSFVYSILGLFLVIWFLYLYFKKDLSLTKKIVSVQHSKDNIANIKVMLVLRNKSLRKLRNVKVMDGMINVVEEPNSFGSIKPNRIMKGEKGTKMLWEIPVIDGNSEIVISYRVKCKAKIIGRLHVPNAVAKYIKNKRRILVRSNKVSMFS